MDIIRRYTEIPFVLDMLQHQRLTLLSPSAWVDTNDSHFISVYQRLNGLKSVLALCFTRAGDTFHHWKIFSGTPSGICVEFRSISFELWAHELVNVRYSEMSYRNLETLKSNPANAPALPFLKRYAYRQEREVRLVWQSKTELATVKHVPIDLRMIQALHTSPWLSESTHEVVKQTIRRIPGCEKISVRRTTMLDSATWKGLGENAV